MMSLTRRGFLGATGSLLASGVLSDLLADDGRADPLAPKKTHHAPKAKAVIFVFLSGGVSHVDSFDPKPKLSTDHGKSVTLDHPETRGRAGYEKLFLKRPDWKFKPRGKCGTEVSDLFPHVAECADDLCVVRSLHTDHSNHYNATLGMHTGSFTVARPSIGAWASYGLGTVNRNLPSFVVLAPQMPYAGTQVWASDFLPGMHQGTRVIPGTEPVANLSRRVPTAARQKLELDLLKTFDDEHAAARKGDGHLAARIKSFETAFGMQAELPAAFDISKETDATLKLYGVDRSRRDSFAWQCLAARRLVERGVRFVELIHTGSSGNWDSHGNMADHGRLAAQVDKPLAGLIADLKRTGLFDSTLVVWTTEFGRTPFNNTPGNAGREHHNWGFSSWLAGGGAKRGVAYGATDEHGIRAAENKVHVHDFHATILHLLGIDHTKLTYRHGGRDYRLTDVHGEVVKGLLA